MFDIKRASAPRCLVAWLAATAAAAALAAWAAPDLAAAHDALTDAGPTAAFDAWLTWISAAVTTLCAIWGWLVASVVVVEALTGRVRRAGSPAIPSWARRLVLVACGVAVVGASTPAMATANASADHADLHQPDDRRRTSILDGLPLPDRAEGGSVSEVVARAIAGSPRPGTPAHPATGAGDPPVRPAPTTTPARPSGDGQHAVRSGDSLWSVAATTLAAAGRGATEAEVAAYWPAIYEANRDVLGPDPDLLLPGQLLELPDPAPITREDDR